MLKVGQVVRAQVLGSGYANGAVMRLGMKQLQPTSIDEYIAEHKEGDVVTGRVADVSGGRATGGIGRRHSGTLQDCRRGSGQAEEQAAQPRADLGSLSSMLSAKWKGGATSGPRERSGNPRGPDRSAASAS